MFVIGELVKKFTREELDQFTFSSKGEIEETIHLKDGQTRKVDITTSHDYWRVIYVEHSDGELKNEFLVGSILAQDEHRRQTILQMNSESEDLAWSLDPNEWEQCTHFTISLQILSEKSCNVSQDTDKHKQNSGLSQDLESLRKNGILTDIAIISERVRFPAHKTVLAARSPVFSAMFSHADTLESHKNEVEVNDVNKATMEMFLTFLYEDTLPKNFNFHDYCDLLKVAHKYQVASLIEACASKLGENINSPREAVQGAILGYVFGITELKDSAVKTIAESDTTLSSMEGYKELLEHPSLLVEMLDYGKTGAPSSAKSNKRKKTTAARSTKRSKN